MLIKFEGVARDANGEPANNFHVWAKNRETGATIAVYSDASGTVTKAQPIVSGEDGVDGRFWFYALDSLIDISVVEQGLSGYNYTEHAYTSATPPLPINVRNYGAKGDGTSDDTQAIQNALNSAAEFGGTVFFPAGHYRIRNLYLGYHVSKNNGWPNSERNFGRIELVGEGPCFRGDIDTPGAGKGSVLDSDTTLDGYDTSDPAISILPFDSNPFNSSSFLNLRKLSIRSNSARWVISGSAVSISVNLENVQIYPNNQDSEGGVEFHSTWLIKWESVNIRGHDNTSEGVGVKMINDDSHGGGILSFYNCDVTNMDQGWQFGDTDYLQGSETTSAPITNINLVGCRGLNSQVQLW